MKNLSPLSIENLKQIFNSKKGQIPSRNFQSNIVSKNQLHSIKGGDDIVIVDIIGD